MKCPFLYVCTHACYDEREIRMFKTIVFFLVFKTTTSIYWKYINIGISISFFCLLFRSFSKCVCFAVTRDFLPYIFSFVYVCTATSMKLAFVWLYQRSHKQMPEWNKKQKTKSTRAETLKRATKQINSEQQAKPYT